MAAAEQPGNLDLGVGIVRTPHWLLLLVLVGLVGGAVAFSFVIKVPVMVKAQGILIPEDEGLKDIVSLTSGRVKTMLVRPGDYVRSGTRVAEVEQPDLSQELREAQNQLVNSRKRLGQIKHFQQRIEKDDAQLRAQEIEILKHLISSNEEHEAWLVDNLNKFKELLKHGYITSQNLMDARVKLYETQAELIRNRNKLNALVYEADSKKIQMERELLELAIEVEEARRTVHSIRQRRPQTGVRHHPLFGRGGGAEGRPGRVGGAGARAFERAPRRSGLQQGQAPRRPCGHPVPACHRGQARPDRHGGPRGAQHCEA